jgi:hypothetical protein
MRERLVADDDTRPYRRKELFTTDDAPAAIGEQHQHIHRLRLEPDRLVAALQLVRLAIGRPIADRKARPLTPIGADAVFEHR